MGTEDLVTEPYYQFSSTGLFMLWSAAVTFQHRGWPKGKSNKKWWSLKHKKCVKCKTTNYLHEARGVCRRCGKQKKQAQLKLQVFKRYGGARCACCGETHFEFLSIDHVNGDGAEHRKQIKGVSIYKWLQRNNFPPGFQVLCFNCNLSIGFFGYCPHKKDATRRPVTRQKKSVKKQIDILSCDLTEPEQ